MHQVQNRFDFIELQGLVPVVAPLRAGSLGMSRAPGILRVRPDGPGGTRPVPDLFFLVSLEEGKLCAVDSEAL